MPVDARFYASEGAVTLEAWARLAGAELDGSPEAEATGVASASSAQAGDVCFFEDKDERAEAISPQALACLVRPAQAALVPEGVARLVTPRPRLAHARVAAQLFTMRDVGGQSVMIDPEAKVHAEAEIGPGTVIGPGAVIGEATRIGANSVIGPGVQVGRRCTIGSHVSVYCALIGDDVALASGVRIGEAGFGVLGGEAGVEDQPHFGRVILQDQVTVGANTTIDRGAFDDTIVGERSKIDNLCQIAHNVRIGRNVLIAAFGGISGSCIIGDGARLGGRAGVADHVTIGQGASLAAAAGVFRDIPDGETWGGTPARPIRQYMRENAWLTKQVKERKPRS